MKKENEFIGRNSPYGKGKRNDSTFSWSLDYDKSLIEWQENFKNFLKTQEKSYNLYRQAINNFIDHLICFGSITRSIKEYVTIEYNINYTYKDYLMNYRGFKEGSTGLRNSLSKMYDFFEWYMITNCVNENTDNSNYDSLYYSNPIKRISISTNKTETIRSSLPMTYLKILEDIIVENDFEWGKKFKNNWVEINDKKVWNPVVSYILLLKIKLPLRTYQFRYLDSGEFDKYIFDNKEWEWIENINSKGLEKGVLHRVVDPRTKKEFVGLYINTNKTSDNNTEKKGYLIPWENKEIINIISDLISWQKKYNPINEEINWVDIDDIQLKKKSKKQLLELGKNSFLFRDYSNKNRMEPIKDSRVQSYWRKLLAELERRVNLNIDDENEKVHFIEKWASTNPIKAYYDLHSLRVSNLTALYQSGVPFHILSKLVAGHSSILMTLYYIKFDISHITQILNDATQKVEDLKKKEFINFIAINKYENIKDNIIFNNKESITALNGFNKTNAMTSDIGICPVSESKCNVGGELIQSNAGQKIYAPVENGPKNCIQCRFFITGVPFLLGLNVKFNELAVAIKEKVVIFKESEKEYEDLYNQRYQLEKKGESFLKWKDLELATSIYTKNLNELDAYLKDWHKLYSLIEQCMIIKKNDAKINKGKFSLLSVGNFEDINIALAESTEFELYDTVCQSSVFYKSIDSNVSNMKRNKIISKMLMYNGLQPSFLLLDDKTSLEVGNEFIKILISKIGKNNVIDVMNEKKKIEDFGLSIDIEKDIKILINSRTKYKNKMIGKN